MRIALSVEYKGNNYHGWQKQANLHTVQQKLESALSEIAASEINVVCAGRTDTGVHATNQIVHFDTQARRDNQAWLFGTNSHLPKDITVNSVKVVNEDFHARFSAQARRYIYVIQNTRVSPAVLNGVVTWHFQPLDHEVMEKAVSYLIGEQDFTSFRSIECQSKTAMRHIQRCTVHRYRDLVVIDITANAFLHHMVRNIAGSLLAVGTGKQPIDWIPQVLEAKDRSAAAETAPPYGLYLVQVIYPDKFELPNDVRIPLFIPAEHEQNQS